MVKRTKLDIMRKLTSFILILYLGMLPLSAEEIQPLFYIVKYINASTFITSKEESIKLEGVITPDLDSDIGQKSLKLVRKLINSGAIIKTEVDKRIEDKAGHKLIYLYIGTDKLPKGSKIDEKVIKKLPNGKYEIFLNAYLIKTGWAKAAITPPNTKYMDLFFGLEEEARLNNRGSFKYNPFW